MRLNILIGGKAGQGINKISGIVSQTIAAHGYFTFNYRDYPSIIRGGHNFNILSLSDKQISSHESKIDIIVALDEFTKKRHALELKKGGMMIDYKKFMHLGLNLNLALSGELTKLLGIEKKTLLKEISRNLKGKNYLNGALEAAGEGYESQKEKFHLRKLNNKLSIMSGSEAVAFGAINSNIDLYFAYPMTPSTNALHELAKRQLEHNFMTFQPEGEIAAINMAIGASFSGARVMVGTSGGGFDLMSEGLSLQGISEVPLTVYLASRVGPGTGIPTYNMQGDLDIALRSGHGEFPRVVISPGDPLETIEKVNEAMYLSEKFKCLSILLSDKHVAESEFSSNVKANKSLPVKVLRKVPGEGIVKASSYDMDDSGVTTEDAHFAKKNAEARIEKYKDIKSYCKKFEMIKIHGKTNSKNLIIGWGSTKGAIVDAINGLDYKFLQVLYMKPLSDQIKKEMLKAKKVILIESNLTGQLGRLIREKTGIKIERRILKYNGRPFRSDELRKELKRI
jgi:2-oxoglutarate/2-oxoacid ferredoxin oxidoreductase subunit alpha